jgi:hypothetical protein
MKPIVHAQNSAKKYGGKASDYIKIHNKMDSSKSVIADHRHRALTHNTWFLFILEEIFGETITNSDKKVVSVRDIGEDHIREDFRDKFIPTAQDWLEHMAYVDWMNNGESGMPSSFKVKSPVQLPNFAPASPAFDDSNIELIPKKWEKSPPLTPPNEWPGSKLID